MSVTTAAPRPQADTRQARARSWRFWVIIAAVVAAAVVLLLMVRGVPGQGAPPLTGDSAAPAGSKALLQVLRQHGVSVTLASTLQQAEDAARADSTVAFYDPHGYLDDEQLGRVRALAGRTVAIDPGFSVLRALAPGVLPAGVPHGGESVSAQCALPAAVRAGTITRPTAGYRIQSASGESCFPVASNVSGLVQLQSGAGSVTVVGSTAVFENQHIAEHGNAALALGLLGHSSSLVWYLPSSADIAHPGPPSLAQLTPGWVTPVIVLLIAAFLAAAVWRGRRFGPLVVEDLPVVVPAGETIHGRARLYQRSSSRAHALDALRIGAIARIAALTGLSASAPVAAVVAAAASLASRPPGETARVLVDAQPRTDAELMALADELGELESAVRSATIVTPAPHAPAPTVPDGDDENASGHRG